MSENYQWMHCWASFQKVGYHKVRLELSKSFAEMNWKVGAHALNLSFIRRFQVFLAFLVIFGNQSRFFVIYVSVDEVRGNGLGHFLLIMSHLISILSERFVFFIFYFVMNNIIGLEFLPMFGASWLTCRFCLLVSSSNVGFVLIFYRVYLHFDEVSVWFSCWDKATKWNLVWISRVVCDCIRSQQNHCLDFMNALDYSQLARRGAVA